MPYLIAATLGLGETPWGHAAMGTDEWIAMLRDGPVAACTTLFYGGTLAEAAFAAMQFSPLVGQDPADYGSLASSIWITMATSGMSLYCPDVARGVADDTTAIVNTWQELVGGDLLDPTEMIVAGTFIVGADVQPGTYRTSGGDMCAWARLSGFSGFSGTSDDWIVAGSGVDQQIVVTIEPSDVGFWSQGCGTWSLVE